MAFCCLSPKFALEKTYCIYIVFSLLISWVLACKMVKELASNSDI